MRCAALIEQKNDRDLQLLPEMVHEVEWLDEPALARTDVPVILCGLWFKGKTTEAKQLLKTRSAHGHTTLLVPRFYQGDLADVLGAPSSVLVRPSETDAVRWEDGESYAVSGVCHIETTLPAGRWASSDSGAIVLGFRPNTSAGPIVVCTAAITSRAIGVKREEQMRLFARIMAKAHAAGMNSGQPVKHRNLHPFVDASSFLKETGPAGGAVALALFAAKGDREADLCAIAREFLGVTIDEEQLAVLLQRLPDVELNDLEVALKQLGWSAYIRRVLQSSKREAQ